VHPEPRRRPPLPARLRTPRRVLALLTAAAALALGPVVGTGPALAEPATPGWAAPGWAGTGWRAGTGQAEQAAQTEQATPTGQATQTDQAAPTDQARPAGGRQSDLAVVAPPPLPLTAPECPGVMAEGEFDGCVTELQHLLDTTGADLLGTGYYGAATTAAVRTYQQGAGLPADGRVDAATKQALYAVPAPAPVPLESPDCPAVVVEGEVDGCVSSVQLLLVGRGYPLSVTGTFDPATRSSVAAYQRFVGLLPTGDLDSATEAALLGAAFDAPPPRELTSPDCPVQLTPGERDGCVTRLQDLLNAHGAALRVTGEFDPDTARAVTDYQRSHGLAGRGVVGPATKDALLRGGTPAPATSSPAPAAPVPAPAAPAPALSGDLQTRIVAAAQAIQAGSAQPGWAGGAVEYVWGGGHRAQPGPSAGACYGGTCPALGAVGLDCSGFARWVYALAYGRDVLGAGGTAQQIAQLSPAASPQPGDLVFFGTDPSHVHHVGVYVGGGRMVNALHQGTVVETDPVALLPDLVGYYRLG
jgi:peptidoglycan hydrolase-like protein with peptidoglycan-binding domain